MVNEYILCVDTMTFFLNGRGLYFFGKELEKIEAIKAKERQLAELKKGTSRVDQMILTENKGRMQDIVAKQVGLGSKGTYNRAKAVVDSGNRDVIDKMNASV